jgi:hypothetical protein
MSAAIEIDLELSFPPESNESIVASEISDQNLADSSVVELYYRLAEDGSD